MQLWEYLTLTVRDGIVATATGKRLRRNLCGVVLKGKPYTIFLTSLGSLDGKQWEFHQLLAAELAILFPLSWLLF